MLVSSVAKNMYQSSSNRLKGHKRTFPTAWDMVTMRRSLTLQSRNILFQAQIPTPLEPTPASRRVLTALLDSSTLAVSQRNMTSVCILNEWVVLMLIVATERCGMSAPADWKTNRSRCWLFFAEKHVGTTLTTYPRAQKAQSQEEIV